jgi:hypothetical protein
MESIFLGLTPVDQFGIHDLPRFAREIRDLLATGHARMRVEQRLVHGNAGLGKRLAVAGEVLPHRAHQHAVEIKDPGCAHARPPGR